jgi:pimeloyl-ACP methyl ester carboxylesterase
VLKGTSAVRSGYVTRSGQRIHWQEFGSGDRTVLLLPTWSIVHSDFWRHQVAFLSPRYRVIAYDGLGNGASDRPVDPSFYGDYDFADDAVAVLDATRTEKAAIASVSAGALWALALAGRHPERVSAAIFIGASVPLAPPHPERAAAAADFEMELAEHHGWFKWNRHYWLSHYPDFLRFFFSKCFTEPESAEQIEHFFQMGMETSPEVLLATRGVDDQCLDEQAATRFAQDLRCPSLVIHGDADAISPLQRGREIARLAGSTLEIMEGAGHEPQCRFPDETNRVIERFLNRAIGP